MANIGGVALPIGAAYLVTNFNNIMDALQLVFFIVNAPLFATFLPLGRQRPPRPLIEAFLLSEDVRSAMRCWVNAL